MAPDSGRSAAESIKERGSQFNVLRAIEAIPAAAASIRFLTSSLARTEKRVVSREEFPDDRPRHWLNALLDHPQPGVNKTTWWRGVGRELWSRGAAFIVLERSSRFPERVIGMRLGRVLGVRRGIGWTDPDAIFNVIVAEEGNWSLRSIEVPARDLLMLFDDQRDPILGERSATR